MVVVRVDVWVTIEVVTVLMVAICSGLVIVVAVTPMQEQAELYLTIPLQGEA
jgi:hypothetical protein